MLGEIFLVESWLVQYLVTMQSMQVPYEVSWACTS